MENILSWVGVEAVKHFCMYIMDIAKQLSIYFRVGTEALGQLEI